MGLYDRPYYRESEGSMTFSTRQGSATMMLIYINVGIFLVDWLLQLDLGRWFGVQGDAAYKPWLWYQYLTYGFLHATAGGHTGWHVFYNMLTLWFFGRSVEDRYGRAEFLRIYLLSVVLCGIVWNLTILSVLEPGQATRMIGASGAVSTIFTLFVCNFPRVTVYLNFLFPVPAWVLGILMLFSNLFGQDGSIAYSAHLAGIAFGAGYFFANLHLGNFMPGKITLPKWRGTPRPKLKIHSEDEEFDPYNDSDEEAERILDKVRDQGMESLSPAERSKLEAYSRRMRQKLS